MVRLAMIMNSHTDVGAVRESSVADIKSNVLGIRWIQTETTDMEKTRIVVLIPP